MSQDDTTAGAPGAAPDRNARLIYRYRKGEREVAADPTVLWRGLINSGSEDFHTLYGEAFAKPADDDRDGQRALFAATARLAERARLVFGVAPLDEDGNGVTEGEATALVADFMAWNLEKKGDGGPSPSGSPPTDGPAPDSPSPVPTAAATATGKSPSPAP